MRHESARDLCPQYDRCFVCAIKDFLNFAAKEGFWTITPVEDDGLIETFVRETAVKELVKCPTK